MLERRIVLCVCLLAAGAWVARGEASEHTKKVGGTFHYGHEALDYVPEAGDEETQEGHFSGSGTHIGAFTGVGEAHVIFLPANHQAIPTDLDKEAITWFTGSFQWTRPEGSLSGTFEGWNYELEGMAPLPIFGGVIWMSVDHGTGRFQGAEGNLLAFGVDDPYGFFGPAGVSAEFAGTLTFDPPPRAPLAKTTAP